MHELTGLPALSPAEAHLRQAIPAALTGRRCGDATLVARFEAVPPPADSWFGCAGALGFAIDRLGGNGCRVSATDGVAAAELLERAEPLLREIEMGLGIELEPLDLLAAAPYGHLVATVETLRRGAFVDRLHLAVPPELSILPAPPQFAPELLGRVHLPATVRLAAPRLAPHDAAALAPGDVLLLGAAPLPARLAVAGLAAFDGRFDPALRRFQPS